MFETWADIKGYEGYYKVSNLRKNKKYATKWNNKKRKNFKTEYS